MYKKGFAHVAYGILKAMKVGANRRGFTIIETLIVLAITGGLFLVAAVAISGRQSRSEFEQSIQDVRSQIEQTINEVSTGYFPNSSNFTCTASVSGPVLGSGSAPQGTNSDCIFLGKVLQFDISGTDPEQFISYPVAALRQQTGGGDVTSLAQAMPKVISPTTAAPTLPNLVEKKKLLYGLNTTYMKYGPPATESDIGAVAFLSSMASFTGTDLDSGSQQVNLYPVKNTVLNANQNAAATAINANFLTSTANPADGVRICFASAGTKESGLITIGSSSRQLSVKLTILKGSLTCGA